MIIRPMEGNPSCLAVSIFCNSAFTKGEFNEYFLLFYSVLAISRSVSPSTESDKEAASPLTDTSPEYSEVGALYLRLKLITSKD